MSNLPAGTVSFLFTDIEGSTRLWERHPQAMEGALARHDALLRRAIEAHGGHVFKTVGDQFCAAFAHGAAALAAALAAQQALQAAAWEQTGPLRVRMALHSGPTQERDGDYFGPALNRVARLLAVGHGGQILLSGATAAAVRAAVPAGASLRDLGSHRLKDLQQPEHLFQLLHPELPAEFPPLRSLEAFAHNLPAQLTSFIGREQEIAAVKQLLATTRLLTLTGSGGCGKTRLALQVAAELLEEYGDGVWLVELAPLADPALVPQSVAAVLGVREEPGRPLTATLLDYLRPKSLLLVLDNCEHLLAACAHLADTLLRGCPQLRLLASSREGLGIAGERTYRVPSLSLPDPTHLPPVERLTEYEAVRLFSERAVLTQPSFVVSEQNARAVAQVCQRLDGIPLALELAAARVKALPVDKLSERLDDMFRLLTGGSRNALPRQQTLRALIDWSYALLSPEEKALLHRLSVFAGGWTLEAAEAVTSDPWSVASEVKDSGPELTTDHWPLATDVLDLLTSLVEKSLVLYEERQGEGRYRLLETVRQYARDRLLQAGDGEAVRNRHLELFLSLAEEAQPELIGPEQKEWHDRLEAEHDNLRAALAWSLGSSAVDAGLRLAAAIGGFWLIRGYSTEGRERLAALLAHPGATGPTAARMKALHALGWLAWEQRDHAAARAAQEESLAIARALGDRRGMAVALHCLGAVAVHQGEREAARSCTEQALVIYRELDDKACTAILLNSLGVVAGMEGDVAAQRALYTQSLAMNQEAGNRLHEGINLANLGLFAWRQGDYAAARALAEQSLAIRRELGLKPGILGSLNSRGEAACCQGDYPAARASLEESLALARELGNGEGMARALLGLAEVERCEGNGARAAALAEESLSLFREQSRSLPYEQSFKRGMADGLRTLGELALAEGDGPRAAGLFAQSLALSRELADRPGIFACRAGSLAGSGAVAVAAGRPERGARLLAAAEALLERRGERLTPICQSVYDRSVAAARTALCEEAFAAAWAEGRAMSLEEAVEYALEAGPDG